MDLKKKKIIINAAYMKGSEQKSTRFSSLGENKPKDNFETFFTRKFFI